LRFCCNSGLCLYYSVISCSRSKCCSSAFGCSACCLYSNPSLITKKPGSIIQNATRTVTTIAIITIVLFKVIILAISLPLGGSLEMHIQTKARRPARDNEVPFGCGYIWLIDFMSAVYRCAPWYIEAVVAKLY
jgi:hypothetical protein